MTDERLSSTRVIAAPADTIFALLTDPQGHVDIDASGMLQDATGSPVQAVGDRFTVHMDREALGDIPEMGKYDVEVEITRFDPGTEIAWTIHGTIKPPLGHVYGYQLSPVESVHGPATEVTSYYDWSAAHPDWKPVFPVISEANLAQTLGILDRRVRRSR